MKLRKQRAYWQRKFDRCRALSDRDTSTHIKIAYGFHSASRFLYFCLQQTAKNWPFDSKYIICPNTRLPGGKDSCPPHTGPFWSSHPPNPVLGMASVPDSVSELWVTWRPEPREALRPWFTLNHWQPQAELKLPHPNPKLGLSNKK